MFQVRALPVSLFAHLFGRSSEALARQGVVASVVGEGERLPCRVSLRDARPGERALLLNYEHQPADTPYRSRHAIFVIDGAEEMVLAPGDLPPVFGGRQLAVRAFDDAGCIVGGGLTAGEEAGVLIEHLFADPAAAYLHVHNAAYGCYAARVDRVEGSSGGQSSATSTRSAPR